MSYPQMIAPDVAVIGRYEPNRLEYYEISNGIQQIVKSFGIPNPSVDIRNPDVNQEMTRDGIASNWHKDVSWRYIDLSMAVWSNREQTEIKLSDETIINPNPGDVVLIHNESTLHRTPPNVSADRWSARCHVETPNWLEIAK